MKTVAGLPFTGANPGAAGHLRRPQRAHRIAKIAFYVTAPLLLLAFFFHPAGHSTCFGHGFRPGKPQSIEERVNHILRHTPLIGKRS